MRAEGRGDKIPVSGQGTEILRTERMPERPQERGCGVEGVVIMLTEAKRHPEARQSKALEW